MYLCGLYLFQEKIVKFVLQFQQPNKLVKRNQYKNLLLKKFTRYMNGRFCVLASRDNYPSSFSTTHETNKVFRYFPLSYGSPKPLHFHEIKIALKLNDTIDLFDDAFARVPYKMKRFLNENAV